MKAQLCLTVRVKASEDQTGHRSSFSHDSALRFVTSETNGVIFVHLLAGAH